MEIVGIIIGLVGLITIPLSFLTYISPKHRVNRYLRSPAKWKEVSLDLDGDDYLWQYVPHPEFEIRTLNDSHEWDYGVTERWMRYPLPDPTKRTYMVHVKAGDVVVYAERFISLDGGRYFVPLPRVKYHDEKEDNEYYYEPLQLRISRVIGRYYRMSSVEEFIRLNEIEVRQAQKSYRKALQFLWHLLRG